MIVCLKWKQIAIRNSKKKYLFFSNINNSYYFYPSNKLLRCSVLWIIYLVRMGAEEEKVSEFKTLNGTQLVFNVKFMYFHMRITHTIFLCEDDLLIKQQVRRCEEEIVTWKKKIWESTF